jgi:hypothetical protein
MSKPSDPAHLFCPHCGVRAVLEVKCDAIVQQGPWDGHAYAFEGEAPHLQCRACGGQFLDWSSDWAHLAGIPGVVILVERGVKWTAFCFKLNTLLAYADFAEASEDLLEEFREEFEATGEHESVKRFANEDLDEFAEEGDTREQAVGALCSKLGGELRAQLLNPEVLGAAPAP